MSSAYDRIGQAQAEGDLEASRAIGIIVGFTHRDDVPVALHAQVVEEVKEAVDGPRSKYVENTGVQFLLPEQSPITTFGGINYSVSGFSGTRGIDQITGFSGFPCIVDGDKIEWPPWSGRNFYVKGPMQIIHNGHGYIVGAIERRTLDQGMKA